MKKEKSVKIRPSSAGARRLALGLALALGAAAAMPVLTPRGAAAQEETFTAEHLKLAREAVLVTKSEGAFNDILPVIADQTKAVFIRSNPALAAQIEEVTTAVAIDLAATRRDLDRTIQEVWARRFSEDELREIIAFYQTPVGAKLADLSPEILALVVGAAKQWSDELSTVMVTRVREEMQKRGYGDL